MTMNTYLLWNSAGSVTDQQADVSGNILKLQIKQKNKYSIDYYK